MLQCGQAMQDYLIHFKLLTRQFHYCYTSQMVRIIVSYKALPPSFLPLTLSQYLIYIFFKSLLFICILNRIPTGSGAVLAFPVHCPVQPIDI